MDEIIKKSIRNGIILGSIAFIVVVVFSAYLQISSGGLEFRIVLLALFGGLFSGIQYLVVGFVVSLAFYYIKKKLR